MQLVNFDRLQFKGMRFNRTYPTIVGWTDELARKMVREENKFRAFGRGTVIPRITKPATIAATTSGQNVEPPVAAESTVNVPSLSVDRVAGVLQKLASTVAEFRVVMADIGKTGAPVNVMKKTFSGISNMLNVASTMEAPSTPTASQLDDIFYGSETFTTTVDALVDELTEVVVNIHWQETENYIDCGIFVMRHMETYNGTLKIWNPGFKRKASLNEYFLCGLRAKYAATIIRWRANTLKYDVIKKTKELYNKK
nr:uncharacterized protein LOC109158994 [Ipomoea batatas]